MDAVQNFHGDFTMLFRRLMKC